MEESRFEYTDNFTGKNEWFYQNCLKRNKVETILCAAVWYRDFPLQEEVVYGCYNVSVGVVICGQRHPHCLNTFSAITGLRSVEPECGFNVQGFLTNCNRFVDRFVAAELAWEAGQLERKPYVNGRWLEIYSEDLY